MGTKITREGAEKVYEAASKWVKCALQADDSLFTPGQPIWSSRWLGELRQRFLNNPDESTAKASFLDKLRGQLEGSPPEVYQLMGEALYLHYLIDGSTNGATKQDRINRVLGWSPAPVEIPSELIAGLRPGILNPGTFFKTSQPYQVGFLIEFAEQWKGKTPVEHQRLVEHPWQFKDFAMQLDLRSELFQGNFNKSRPQKAALLHLTFPDIFEPIASVRDKEQITKTFANYVTQPTEDVDRHLAQIRLVLEAKYGSEDHFFYRSPVVDLWKKTNPSVVLPPPPPPPPPPSADPWAAPNIKALAGELLWEPGQLQKVVDGLKDKRQVIFQGPPGTGKTYVAKRIAEWCKEHGGDFQIVQFHPSYSYEDFVEGFRPRIAPGDQAGFKLTDGPLRRIAKKA